MRIVNSLHADRPIIIDTVDTNNNSKSISFATLKLFKNERQAQVLFWINETSWAEFVKVFYKISGESSLSLKRIFKASSLGTDALVVDQATLHHMIFPALLAVCEDAIHREWIGSAVYHHNDLRCSNQHTRCSDIYNCIILQRPVCDVTAASFVYAHTHIWFSWIYQQDASTHVFCYSIILGIYCVSNMHF